MNSPPSLRGPLSGRHLLPLVLLAGPASLADAQEGHSPTENPPPVEAPTQEPTETQTGTRHPWPTALIVDGALGIGLQHRNGWGFALDVAGRLQLSCLEVGAVAGQWAVAFGPSYNAYYGLLAGYRHGISDPFVLELLVEGGRHEEEISGSLFSGLGHGWAVLPYAGLRAGIDAYIGGRLRLVIGLVSVLRADLKTEHVVVNGNDLGTAGGFSAAIQLRLGFNLGLD